MIIMNTTRNITLAQQAKLADTFWLRLRGLLGTDCLPDGNALIIKPCSSVHTFGMKYPIDVIFAGKDNRILKTVDAMRPGGISACSGSSYVVELPAGSLAATRTSCGDIIEYR